MFVKLKAQHSSADPASLNFNPDHVSLVFNRGKRVVLRMMDGIEIPLDEEEFRDADKVADMIDGARGRRRIVEVVNPDDSRPDARPPRIGDGS